AAVARMVARDGGAVERHAAGVVDAAAGAGPAVPVVRHPGAVECQRAGVEDAAAGTCGVPRHDRVRECQVGVVEDAATLTAVPVLDGEVFNDGRDVAGDGQDGAGVVAVQHRVLANQRQVGRHGEVPGAGAVDENR